MDGYDLDFTHVHIKQYMGGTDSDLHVTTLRNNMKVA